MDSSMASLSLWHLHPDGDECLLELLAIERWWDQVLISLYRLPRRYLQTYADGI